jgi:hypothetical protein
MCILPNMQVWDLEELSKRRKKRVKKAEVKAVEIVVPDHPPLETRFDF